MIDSEEDDPTTETKRTQDMSIRNFKTVIMKTTIYIAGF